VGYGFWTQTLRIHGAVYTGSLSSSFSVHEIDQGIKRGSVGGPTNNGVSEHIEFDGREHAYCYTRIAGDPVPLADETAFSSVDLNSRAGDQLFILVKGGYPSFNCYVDFDVHNLGSIPVKLNKPLLGRFDPNALTVDIQDCYEAGTQVDPGREALCTIQVHVESGAAQNSLYRFGASICAYQFNADGLVPCPVPIDDVPVPAPVLPLQPVVANP
jgi:hypothetical protein